MPRATITARLAVLEQLIAIAADNVAGHLARMERERATGMERDTLRAQLEALPAGKPG